MPIFPLTRARADDGQAARSRPSSAGGVETSELKDTRRAVESSEVRAFSWVAELSSDREDRCGS